MAYKKGEVEMGKQIYPDYRKDEYGHYETYRVIELPHSCDEWVIGGKEEALQLIADLQELLAIHYKD